MSNPRPSHSSHFTSRSPERGHFPASADDYEDGEDGTGLVLPADGFPGSQDNLQDRVQSTQNRLAQLRAEAEALEREKQQFEELSRKQREFMQGRTEVTDKLARALAHVEREGYEAQKRVEQLHVIRESFTHHLDVVESLNPEQWNSQDLQHDLNRALGIIEDAREEFAKGAAHVQFLTSGAAPAGVVQSLAAPARQVNGSTGPHSPSSSITGPDGMPLALNRETFRVWMFCGLGFTLPLLALGVLFFIAWLIAR